MSVPVPPMLLYQHIQKRRKKKNKKINPLLLTKKDFFLFILILDSVLIALYYHRYFVFSFFLLKKFYIKADQMCLPEFNVDFNYVIHSQISIQDFFFFFFFFVIRCLIPGKRGSLIFDFPFCFFLEFFLLANNSKS